MNDSANLFALSAIPQAAYQTDLAPSSVPKKHRQIEKSDRAFAKFTTEAADNKGKSTGTPYATRRTIESHDVTQSLEEELSSQLLPERAYGAMGSIETVEVVGDAVWAHTLEMLNPQESAQLPAYGYVEKAAESASRPNAHNVKYPSMCFDQWSVKGEGRAILMSQSQLVGSGKRISPSGVTFFDPSSQVILLEDMVQNYFRNTAANLKLYPQAELAGSVYTVSCNFRDFEFSINNNLKKDAGYLGCGLYQTSGDSESGAIRGKNETGDQQVQFNFTILMDDAYDAYAKMQAMQSISAQLEFEGSLISGAYKHKATFLLNAAKIVDIDHSPTDGDNAIRITTEPLAIGQVMPVSLVVVNNVESYAHASW
jgi:hypothetical protein